MPALTQRTTSFPGLTYWYRQPAFICWLSQMLGIITAVLLPIPCAGMNARILWAIAIVAGSAMISVSQLSIRIFSAFVLGAALLLATTRPYQDLASQIPDQISLSCRGTVQAPPYTSVNGYKCVLLIDSLNDSMTPDLLKNATVVCTMDSMPPTYSRLQVSGSFRLPRMRTNPGSFDPAISMFANGYLGTFAVESFVIDTGFHATPWQKVVGALRASTMKLLSNVHNEEYRGLLLAAFLGETEVLSPRLQNDFLLSGIYHLLALSGFNVAMLSGFVLLMLWPVPFSRSIKICICILIIWLYQLCIGWIPSLTRASIMATIVLFSFCMQKKNHAFNTLGLAGCIWCAISPWSVFTPGYQLSFLATFGILAVVPLFPSVKKPSAPVLAQRGFDFLIPLLTVSLSAMLCTLPVSFYSFDRFSLSGILANIPAIPLMSIALWAIFLGMLVQVVYAPLCVIPVFIAETSTHFLCTVAHWFAGLPGGTISTISPYPEWIVLYALFIVGMVTIEQKLRKRFLYIGLPLIVVLCFLTSVLRTLRPFEPSITVFQTRSSLLATIQLSRTQTVCVGYSQETPIFSTVNRTIVPWQKKSHASAITEYLVIDSSKTMHQFRKSLNARFKTKALHPGDTIISNGHDSLFVHEGYALISSKRQRVIVVFNNLDSVSGVPLSCNALITSCKWFTETTAAISTPLILLSDAKPNARALMAEKCIAVGSMGGRTITLQDSGISIQGPTSLASRFLSAGTMSAE